jgi:hypothetical protein
VRETGAPSRSIFAAPDNFRSGTFCLLVVALGARGSRRTLAFCISILRSGAPSASLAAWPAGRQGTSASIMRDRRREDRDRQRPGRQSSSLLSPPSVPKVVSLAGSTRRTDGDGGVLPGGGGGGGRRGCGTAQSSTPTPLVVDVPGGRCGAVQFGEQGRRWWAWGSGLRRTNSPASSMSAPVPVPLKTPLEPQHTNETAGCRVNGIAAGGRVEPGSRADVSRGFIRRRRSDSKPCEFEGPCSALALTETLPNTAEDTRPSSPSRLPKLHSTAPIAAKDVSKVGVPQ